MNAKMLSFEDLFPLLSPNTTLMFTREKKGRDERKQKKAVDKGSSTGREGEASRRLGPTLGQFCWVFLLQAVETEGTLSLSIGNQRLLRRLKPGSRLFAPSGW